MPTSNTLQIIVNARDNASKTLEGIEKKIGMTRQQMKITGTAMLGAGTLMAAGLVSAANAAAEEEAGVLRLSVAMRNAGLSYDDSRESLEQWIDAMQQKTSVADDQQREALANLITVTGDMTEAQNLLSTAMDLARWKNIDLGSAADILTKVYAGNMGALSRYGIIVDENATAVEALAAIQKMAAGQAEAYGQSAAGQMELLKNNVGDLKENLGAALLPVLADVVGWVQKLVQWLKGLNPQVVKAVAVAIALASVFSTVGGAILLVIGFLPQLAAGLAMVKVGFAAVNLVMMANPIGIIIAAVIAIIAAIVLLIKNWDKVKLVIGAVADWAKEKWGGLLDWFGALPDKIKGIFEKVGEFMTAPIRGYFNVYIKAWNWLASMLSKVNISIPAWVPGIGGKSFGINLPTISRTFAQGGWIDEPTLMYGMKSGRYSLAGEKGPEYISPSGGGVTININNPSVRNDDDLRQMREMSSDLAWQVVYRMRSARSAA